MMILTYHTTYLCPSLSIYAKCTEALCVIIGSCVSGLTVGAGAEGVWVGGGSGSGAVSHQRLLDPERRLCLCGGKAGHDSHTCPATAFHVAHD